MKSEWNCMFQRARRSAVCLPKVLFSVFAVLLMLCGTMSAQLAGKGAISGTVSDPTGAAIPGATIAITNTTTGLTTRTTSTSAGDYNVSTLDPGNYTVVVAARGFRTLTQENVQVNALETQNFNPKLTIGESTETVEVTSAPPQLESSNATLGATLENDMYSALPVEMGAYGQPDQRRATDFAALMPGVQFNETNGNATTNTGVVNGSGSRGAASAVYIDGVPFTNAAGEGDPRFVWTAISVDAVDQFQVQTSGYPALYEGQGVENFNVKQGGDKYHGAVYEFFRNTALDSWGFYKAANPVTGQLEKPVEHQNEYGILLSGPLVPLGSWRHKLFFFGNYNGFRYLHSAPNLVTFPNAAEQAGNFAGIAKIYDPSTQTACTAFYGYQCRYEYGYTHGASPSAPQVPVPGEAPDQIPSTEFNATALAMQAGIPALTNQNVTNNYVSQNSSALSNWSTTDRIDWAINPKDSLSLTAALGRQASSVPVGQTTSGRNTGPLPYNYGQAYAPKTVVGIIEETHVFTDHLVNQFKYGFARYDSTAINADNNPAYSATAVPITLADCLPDKLLTPSRRSLSPASMLRPAGPATRPTPAVSNSYTLIDNVQWIKGKHSITIGADLAWIQYNYNTALGGSTPLTLATAVTETAGFTSTSSSPTPSTGDAYASFLIGQIDKSSLTQNTIPETGGRFRPISPYIQDTWKVNNRLTLDLGLRYDYYPTYTEAHNVLSYFDPTLTNPVTGSLGAIQYAGTGAGTCNCKTNVNNYFKNFGPRIGFAFQSDAKTVWRGSFGVMYTHGNGVGGSAVSRTGTGTLGFSASPSFSSNTATYVSNQPLLDCISELTHRQLAWLRAMRTAPATPTYPATPVRRSRSGTAIPNMADVLRNTSPTPSASSTSGHRTFTTTISYVGTEGHFLIADGSNANGYWSDQLDPKYLSLGSCLGVAVSKLSTTCKSQLSAMSITVPSWFNTSQTLSTALLAVPAVQGQQQLRQHVQQQLQLLADICSEAVVSRHNVHGQLHLVAHHRRWRHIQERLRDSGGILQQRKGMEAGCNRAWRVYFQSASPLRLYRRGEPALRHWTSGRRSFLVARPAGWLQVLADSADELRCSPGHHRFFLPDEPGAIHLHANYQPQLHRLSARSWPVGNREHLPQPSQLHYA